MTSILKVGKLQSSTGQDAVTVADSGAITANGNITASGTLTTTGAITASGGIANAGTITAGTIGGSVNFPSGHIIKVVHGELPSGLVSTTQETISSSSMPITISSSSHYVLVIVSGGSYRDGGGAAHHQYLTLNGGGFGTGYNTGQQNALLQAAYNYQFNHLARDGWAHSRLDTNPGGTSVTYTLHGHPQNDGGGTVTIRYTNVNYTLMEIRP